MNKIKEAIKQLEGLKEHYKSIQKIYDCTNYEESITAIDTAVEVLENLPTTEALQIRHGHNITTEHPTDEFICSECGIYLADFLRIEDTACYEYIMKHCPNCGAKMED